MHRRLRTSVRMHIVVVFLGFLLAAATPTEPTYDTRYYNAGKQLLEKQNWKAAASEFERAVKINPRHAETHIGLGVALWGLGEKERALAEFQRATDIDPKSAEAHFDIGLSLKDFGETGRAISELETALKLQPDHERARLMLGLLVQQKGDRKSVV